MTEEELRELFCDLRSSNITPLLCDTKVPLYGAPVPCGEPTYCPEDITDSVQLPKAILSMHPEFMIPVKGDSMRDAGIVAGDTVKVGGQTVETGNAVKSMKLLAVATGDYTASELNKDATLGWTKKAKELIDADKAAMQAAKG